MDDWTKPLMVALGTGALGGVVTWLVAVLASRDKVRERSSQDIWLLIGELQEEIKGAKTDAKEAREEAKAARTEARSANERADTLEGLYRAERATNDNLTTLTATQAAQILQLQERVKELEGGRSDRERRDEARMDRAEAREIERDEAARDTDDRRDERERNLQ
ncbi:MAG: hypothetical protein ABIR11_03565 [Candidatus Limnocylindrales bacterium]